MAQRFLLLFACLLWTGCAATQSFLGITPRSDVEMETRENRDAEPVVAHEDADVLYAKFETALKSELEDWYGTPHVWGGTSRSGVDCSGLIKQVYADLLGVQTKRTTGELIEEGQHIRKSKLKAGDLVFFSPNAKKGSHVGIYLSEGDFAHASSSRGVMTSSLSNPYWTRHYETGRRLILDELWLQESIRRIEERQSLAKELQSSTK